LVWSVRPVNQRQRYGEVARADGRRTFLNLKDFQRPVHATPFVEAQLQPEGTAPDVLRLTGGTHVPITSGGNMKKVLTIAALTTCLAIPAYAASEADCEAMWKKADVNKDGTLSDAEAMRYAAAMRVHEYKASADGKITHANFIDACKSDVYTPKKIDPGAPLKGSNSFTEGQAKDRAMAHGYSSIASMVKDGDGIWRGSAMQDGKAVQIAVDYKGNVVPQPAP
jgi:hypothetical protein